MLDIHRRSPLRRQEEGLCVYISYLPGHNLLCGDARRHFFLEPFFFRLPRDKVRSKGEVRQTAGWCAANDVEFVCLAQRRVGGAAQAVYGA